MKTIFSLITALALVSGVNAQDKQPGIPEAQKLMQRAKEAKEAGRYDEARELAEQAQKIGGMHREGKPGINGGAPERLEKVRHEIEELHRAGKHEEAEKLQHRVAEAMAHKKGLPSKEGEGPARLRHLMEAIHHLREAGINEPADSLEKMAHEMKEELGHREQADKGRKPEPGPKDGPPRKGDKPHPPGDELHAMREQMEKMSRAIEELRAQIKGRGDEEVRKPRRE